MATNSQEVELLLSLKDEISKGLDRIDGKTENLGKTGEKTTKSMKKLGSSFPTPAILTAVGAVGALSAGFLNNIKIGAKFEQSMANVNSISSLTANQFTELSGLARSLGESTVFSASEASDAFLELSKLGLNVEQIMASADDVLNLASATGRNMAETAEVMASTLAQFGLDASQATKVADVMANSFASSALDMTRFSESMKYVGPVANAVGNSLEDTTALLEILANNAIHGTNAGTALRRIFIDLGDESSKASSKLKELGIETTATVTEKFEALSEAGMEFSEVADVFGKISATSAQVLIENADLIEGFAVGLDKAGVASDQASKRLNTLNGDIKLLNSSWEELNLTVFEAQDGMGRASVQWLTDEVKLFTSTLKENDNVFGVWVDNLKNYNLVSIVSRAIVGGTVTEVTEKLKEKAKEMKAIDDEIANTIKEQSGKVEMNPAFETVVSGVSGGSKKDKKDKVSDFEKERLKNISSAFEDQKKIRKEQDSLLKKGEKDRLDMQREALDITKMQREEDLKNFQLNEEKKNELSEENITRRKQLEKDLSDYQKLLMMQTLQGYATFFGGLASLESSAEDKDEGRRKRIKALLIAEATANTALAVTKTLSSYPFPFSLIPATGVASAGIAQVNNIRQQKFATGGIVQKEIGVPSTGDRHTVGVNPGEEILTADDPRHRNNGGGSVVNNITISGNIGVDEDKLAMLVVKGQDRATRTGQPNRL